MSEGPYIGVSTRTPYPIPCSTVCLISHSFKLRRERNEGEPCGRKGKTPAGGRGGTAIACELGPEFVRVVLNSAPNATPPPPTPPTPPPPPPPTSPPLPPAHHRRAHGAGRSRLQGGAREAYEKKVILLLAGVTAPRRSRVRAAAAAAAANSGPYYRITLRW